MTDTQPHGRTVAAILGGAVAATVAFTGALKAWSPLAAAILWALAMVLILMPLAWVGY